MKSEKRKKKSIKKGWTPKKYATIILILLFEFYGYLNSQSKETSAWLNDDWYYAVQDSSLFDTAELLPRAFRDQVGLKRWLRDPRFYDLRKQHGDSLAIDALFDRAMLLADGDPGEALYLCLFSVMDHRIIRIRVPLIGSVPVPLTLESDSLFKRRYTNLPKQVLRDGVRTPDKDKLQHFFGSAWLTYISHSPRLVQWIGDLLELGEDRFVVGGTNDPRDKKANELGRMFGSLLLKETTALPSDVLGKK